MNIVGLGMDLALLTNFLDHVVTEASQEVNSIEDRRLAGKFASFEDYEGAVDLPFARVAIASRSVSYELVALVEAELQSLAYEPWLASSRHKGPKNIFQLSHVNSEMLTKLRMVSDLPFDTVITLIENHFGITLAHIEGWSEIHELRSAINAFKHRRGFKHPRDISWGSKDGMRVQRYDIGQKEAMKALATVASFFRALKPLIEPGSKQQQLGDTGQSQKNDRSILSS
ncbi:MAG: hypothetical protein ACREJN_07730 [Nitrospiraceae bacterium]